MIGGGANTHTHNTHNRHTHTHTTQVHTHTHTQHKYTHNEELLAVHSPGDFMIQYRYVEVIVQIVFIRKPKT